MNALGKKTVVFLLSFFVMVTVYAENENKEGCLEECDSTESSEEQYFEYDIYEDDVLSSDSCVNNNDENEGSYFSYLDTSEKFISSGINSLAIYLDEFFANEKTDYDSSGSDLRISSYVIFNEGGRVSSSSNINFKLRLPNTEEKFKFVFETDSAELDDNSKQTTTSNQTVDDGEKEYFAGLQAILKDDKHWRFRTSSGIHLTTSLDPFIRFNMDWRDKFGVWDLHWNENPYWLGSTGWGLNSLFEIDRKISDSILFRSSSSARWTAILDSFNLSQVFSVSQVLTNKSAISYQAGVYGVSKPVIATTNYLLSMSYRKNIYKDYLFFEMTPQINYPESENFSPVHSLTFKLDMIFKD